MAEEYSEDELKRWGDTLLGNKKKNFVQRAINPRSFPQLDNGDRSFSTHSMASNHIKIDGKEIEVVYPTVVQAGPKLVRLSDEDAKLHAAESGEYIEFKDKVDGRKFARGGYKKAAGWE
jgi:hypothetical protein